MRFIFSVARIAGLMLAALLCATSVQAEAPTPISGEQIIRQLSAFLADRKITSTPRLTETDSSELVASRLHSLRYLAVSKLSRCAVQMLMAGKLLSVPR